MYFMSAALSAGLGHWLALSISLGSIMRRLLYRRCHLLGCWTRWAAYRALRSCRVYCISCLFYIFIHISAALSIFTASRTRLIKFALLHVLINIVIFCCCSLHTRPGWREEHCVHRYIQPIHCDGITHCSATTTRRAFINDYDFSAAATRAWIAELYSVMSLPSLPVVRRLLNLQLFSRSFDSIGRVRLQDQSLPSRNSYPDN
jgi:uncharacterized membrane protein